MGVPRTADGDGFRFRAGRASLDLCSTVLWRHVEPVELLRGPDDVGRWFVGSGLWDRPYDVSLAEVRAVRQVREALYGLFLASIRGDRLPAATVVNRWAAHPDPAPQLRAGGQVRWRIEEPVSAGLSAVARDGIDVLTGPLSARLRECAAPDCAFLFVDSSRPGTRRWCAHNRCGNREHVREHRARQSSTSRTSRTGSAGGR